MNDTTRRLSTRLRTLTWAARHKLHFIYIYILLGTVTVLASVGYMHMSRGPQNFRAGVGQEVGMATLKTPPGWSYEGSTTYSLRAWLSDIVLWSTATDVDQERQAPAW
jgi:hypothetical protein